MDVVIDIVEDLVEEKDFKVSSSRYKFRRVGSAAKEPYYVSHSV